jgi:translation initiation factor 1
MSTQKQAASSGLVYSTTAGRMCPGCRRPAGECLCGREKSMRVAEAVVRVSRETKGRNGKSVTVIRGLGLEPAALEQIGKQLRTACGSGGTVKDGVIEVQGDHCERVMQLLRGQGRVVKRAGG